MQTSGKKWGTREEFLFLCTLREARPIAFARYRSNFSLREDWGAIDSVEIARFLDLKQCPHCERYDTSLPEHYRKNELCRNLEGGTAKYL